VTTIKIFAPTVKLKIFADKNICGNNICGHEMIFLHVFLISLAVGTVLFSDRKNIYRKYFYPQFFFFFIWAMTVLKIYKFKMGKQTPRGHR
jgi:hypothetical protein